MRIGTFGSILAQIATKVQRRIIIWQYKEEFKENQTMH